MSKKISFLFLTVIAVLFAFAGCKSAEEPVDSVTSVVFDREEITLKVGESMNINATVEPDELSDAKLTWKSSNESVATVSRGLVTAVSEGKTVITAVSENCKLDSCIVTVIEDDKTSDDDEGGKTPTEDDKKPEQGDDGDGKIPDEDDKKPEQGDDGEDDKEPVIPEINRVSYTVTLSTVGGMSMAACPIYFYEYTDGELGEFLEYSVTDENGKAEIKLPENGSYAVVIGSGIPAGYIVEPFYPFTSQNLDIKITSEVIDDTMPSDHKYSLGDVMYDFTVTVM